MGIIAKQSFRGTIVTYLGVAVGFLTTFFVLTRFLTAEEIGLARVLIDAATLFVGLAQMGTSTSIIRFYPYFHSREKGDHGFFFWTLIVPAVGFLLFTIIYWLGHTPLAQWFGEKSPLFVDYYYFVLPVSFFMLYQTIFETNANVLMSIVVPRTVRELYTRVGMLVLYLLYAFRILSMDGFVIGLSVVYGSAMLINLCYLFSLQHISLRPDWTFLRANRPLVRNYLFYTGFLLISALTANLAPVLSSFFVTAKMGLDYTGIFAIATYIAVMVSIPYRSVTAIASPQLAQALKEGDHNQATHLTRQVAGNLLLIGGFILLAIWINIDLIFTILPNGATYAPARYVVLILGLSQLLVATFTISASTLNFSRYYALSLVCSIVLMVLSLVFNNQLIPLFGINGAALSNLLAYAIYFALVILIVSLTTRIRFFSRRMLLTTLLLLVLFGLNYLLSSWLGGASVWLSAILRSVVLIGIGLLAAYRLSLSPELNTALHTFLHRN